MMMHYAMGLAVLAGAISATPALADGYLRKTNGDIQFANYPRESLVRGEEGVVGLKLQLDKRGRLASCAVSKSSGYAALDAASCDLLIANARMKPFLSPDGRKIEKETEGRVVWQLPKDRAATLAGTAPPPQTASKAVLARAGEKTICKSRAEIGSLVKTEKVCLTRAEWQRQYNFAQEEAQDMKGKSMTNN